MTGRLEDRRNVRYVIGNWKLHGGLASNAVLLEALLREPVADVVAAVCVPYPYLAQVSGLLAGQWLGVGAQDVSEHEAGAYTGEVSAAMLCEFGCRWVIVGHSERRALFAEGDERVARKARAALAAGLVPIVCVGEGLAEREAGHEEAVVLAQLEALRAGLGVAGVSGVVLAYEPVWAIGTGRTATVGQVARMHAAIRAWLGAVGVPTGAVPVLYGGSVKPSNAAQLFAIDGVDGGLIGGASLVAGDFAAICRAARPGSA